MLYNVGLVFYELVAGLAVGLAVGFAGAWVMRRAALPSSGLYPLAVMALCFLAYGSAAAGHASGFAAVYVAALVLGNAELPHRAATRSFGEGLAWLAQIGLFVMLGLLLSPGRIDLETIGYAVVAGLVLTLVARPVSVLVSSVVQPMPLRELAFISWAGLRGAVPIVLATIPLAEGVRDSERLFDIVFVLVVIYTLVTGPTLPLVAKVLRVARRSEPRGLEIEAAPLERVAADLLQVTISPVSKMHGVEVGELRLPAGLVGLDDHPRRRDAGARAPDRAQARRRPARGHPATPAREDRGTAAPGQRPRPAGAVAGLTRRAASHSTGGLQTTASSLRITDSGPCRSSPKASPTTTVMPAAVLLRVLDDRHLADPGPEQLRARVVEVVHPDLGGVLTSVPLGALAVWPSAKPTSWRVLHGPAGQSLARARVEHADRDVLDEQLVARRVGRVHADRRRPPCPGTAWSSAPSPRSRRRASARRARPG